MKTVLKSNIKAGSRETNEPRLLGSIMDEMLHSNEPLAKGFRQYIASQEEGKVDGGWNTNTEPCCVLKTILRSDRRAKTCKGYLGVLRRDEPTEEFGPDEHYTFVEALPQMDKRNPRVYEGRYITATRREDGSLRLNFKHLDVCSGFSTERYAEGVRHEICRALEGLVEEAER